MAWGGFIDKDGSQYLKNMAMVEKTLKFLEFLKKELNSEEKIIVEKTIQIICDHIETFNKEKRE